MKTVRIPLNNDAMDPGIALRLIESIGLNTFATKLLEDVEAVLPSSHCTIFGSHGNGRMEVVASASAIGEIATITAMDYMRSGFDRLDSNTLWLSRMRPASVRQFWIGHQFAADVSDDPYRRMCYEEPGIRERLSLLSVFPDGYRVSLSFYRNHAYRDYTDADMAWLGRQAPLFAAAVMQHVRVCPKPATRQAQGHGPIASLSGREREVISHILEGLTTRQAAVEMGVTTATAATYRYRAFRHLGVRTTYELFASLRQGGALHGQRRRA
jgi:DNA-binding CsgD family transcriptional regulator